MEHYSLLEVIVIELSILAVFAVLVSAYLEKGCDSLFLVVVITLVMGPIMYFYLLNMLIELYFEKDESLKKAEILLVLAFLLLVLFILSIVDIGSLWYKAYIAILLVSVLQIYLTVKFRDKLSKNDRNYEL